MFLPEKNAYTTEQARLLASALTALGKSNGSMTTLLLSMKLVDKKDASEKLKVLTGIPLHAGRMLNHLLSGYEKSDISLLDWAVRSLVELRVWNRYVIASAENMQRFHDDSIIDNVELQELLAKSIDASQCPPETLGEIAEEIKTLNQSLGASTVQHGEKGLSVKNIAKSVGLAKLYNFWFGAMSKYAHPTPTVLINIEAENEMVAKESLDPMLVAGVQCGTEIFNTTMEVLGMTEAAKQWCELQKKKEAKPN